jgi:hypothetical protein
MRRPVTTWRFSTTDLIRRAERFLDHWFLLTKFGEQELTRPQPLRPIPLTIDGKSLKAGTYTLWTIPGAEFWKVIFNDKQYAWGVGKNGASRKAEFDVLVAEVPVEIQE